MRLALEYAAPLGLPLVEHCQDEDLVGGGVMHEGAIATLLGLRGWPAAGEDVMLARDLALVRLTGARYHAAHLSTAGAVELIRAGQSRGAAGDGARSRRTICCSPIAGWRASALARWRRRWRLGLSRRGRVERYDTNTKVNPPLRTAADCAALLAGLLDGTIDAIATDHAPHTQVDKDCEYRRGGVWHLRLRDGAGRRCWRWSARDSCRSRR